MTAHVSTEEDVHLDLDDVLRATRRQVYHSNIKQMDVMVARRLNLSCPVWNVYTGVVCEECYDDTWNSDLGNQLRDALGV